jgi:hypothetical protein
MATCISSMRLGAHSVKQRFDPVVAQLDAFGLQRLSGTVEQAGFSGSLEKLQGPAIGTLEHFRAEPRIPD